VTRGGARQGTRAGLAAPDPREGMAGAIVLRAMRALAVAVPLLAAPLFAQQDAKGTPGYLVLAAVAADDPYHAAARVLAEHHRAEIVAFDPANVEPLRAVLARTEPRHVALVLRPEQLDFVFQRRFLQLATEVDDDPFVDFAFGYVTGRTADDAHDLARRGVARAPEPVDGGIAMVAGGGDTSSVRGERLPPGARGMFDGLQLFCAGAKAFPETKRDVEFLRANLPKLKGRDAVTFVGHGYPREVSGGPTFADLDGVDLANAVVLNVACYTGVTHRWFDDDWRNGTMKLEQVPLAESFGLAVLHAGVLGYTAYLCPRPAGPELETDLAALLAGGASLGDARRRDYDKTVLGFLGFGEERLRLREVGDGAALPKGPDAVRDLMLEGATGGVLFGDPACVPFVARPDDVPVQLAFAPGDGAIAVTARVVAPRVWSNCSDPTARWGKEMAMRVHARVPLGERHVTDVVVDSCTVGPESPPTRVLWAVERDHGERFLQLKVAFQRVQKPGELRLAARVVTTADAALGKLRGGEVHPVPRRVAPAPVPAGAPPVHAGGGAPARDSRGREIDARLLERARARGVDLAALKHALDASARLLGDREVPAAALERFGARGSNGFRATCALLDVGHVHHRTWELLQATWRPGDEQLLLELARGPQLPNFASWSVLRGLAAADTPEVRAYLAQRLAEEPDPGLYMSVAGALAQLGLREHAAAIGARVREARNGWHGVEPHLLASLEELGGAEGTAALAAIAAEADGRCAAGALAALERLDRDAAARVRAARERR
jgi:hypothetical protein